MSKITPCLWFNGKAEEAARFYTSVFPDSAVDEVWYYPENVPGPAGGVMLVEFTIAGQTFQALNGGPPSGFTEAISMSVSCANQQEVDHYWETLTAGGGKPSMCGWLKDRYGVSWQVVPEALLRLQRSGDKAGIARMMGAMMQMRRLDIAALEQAFRGA